MFIADHVATIVSTHTCTPAFDTVNTCCLLELRHPASHGSGFQLRLASRDPPDSTKRDRSRSSWSRLASITTSSTLQMLQCNPSLTNMFLTTRESCGVSAGFCSPAASSDQELLDSAATSVVSASVSDVLQFHVFLRHSLLLNCHFRFVLEHRSSSLGNV